MKACLLHSPARIETNPLDFTDTPDPVPAGDELLVRVAACGICRTDLHLIDGEVQVKRPPRILGHQIVGIVDGTERRVGVPWVGWTCGACEQCLGGHENLCPNARFTGYDEDGGYAECAVVPEAFAYHVPASLDPVTVAPLLCAGIIGYRALKRAQMRPGCRLGLYGFGSSASIAIQIARHLGCTVFVMTRDEKHQRLARQLGAAWAGSAEARPPEPLDSAVLFAPVGELVLPALEALDRGGTLAVAGIHLTDIPAMNYERHLFYEKNLTSVTANTRKDGEELLRLAAEVPLKPQTTRFALADANRALQLLKHDGISGSGVLEIA